MMKCVKVCVEWYFEYLLFWKWNNEDLINKVKSILDDVCENCKFSVFVVIFVDECW